MYFERIKPSAHLQHVVECYWIVKEKYVGLVDDFFRKVVMRVFAGKLQDKKLKATISGNGKSIDYFFEKF